MMQEVLCNILDSLRSFLFWCLGLPLFTKRLTHSQCQPLIDKIKQKIFSWTAKRLSYAGRKVLIQAVLTGMITLWSALFLLLRHTIGCIESLCSRFLWSGAADAKKLALVGWPRICQPIQYEGLGFKEVLAWNKALCTRWIWKLVHIESVFRQWALKYMVKQDSIFATQGRIGDACGWKTIISLRNDINHIAGSADAAHERFQEEEYQVSKWHEFFKPVSTKVYWWKVAW